MKKTFAVVAATAFLLTIALPLHAQGGCVNSPENPTIVLALVGSAGAVLASVRTRIKARRMAGNR
jgi:XrtJ-associated TM-motif-TM protein